jgi:hypothetical protein
MRWPACRSSTGRALRRTALTAVAARIIARLVLMPNYLTMKGVVRMNALSYVLIGILIGFVLQIALIGWLASRSSD